MSRYGYPAVEWADDPAKFYARHMYREWFYGPFDSLDEVRALVRNLDEREPWWDYDGFAVTRGSPVRDLAALPRVPRSEWAEGLTRVVWEGVFDETGRRVGWTRVSG